ncbi:MAG: GAF domain-containing protein [Gammaproteobacteria bacterium]|nr:GAF domain-containing protein [Gammaproteobacteria bacterium]
MISPSDILSRIEKLNSLGISLSAEKDKHKLLKKILEGVQTITNADGGTLYLLDEPKKHLRFEILQNHSKGIYLGGPGQPPINLAPVRLRLANGKSDTSTVAAYAANTGTTVNIADAYESQGFDFSGTKEYDRIIGYRSKSFLTIPMRNHESDVIGVLQLINSTDKSTGEVVPFTSEDQRLAESLASQAAVALTTHILITDLQVLLEKFIGVIADAIDEKSPYTGSHCRRIPEIAMMFAQAIHDNEHGPLAEVRFSDEHMYEIKIAALMHDCGKITTPVHVIEKSTKLETIFDRMELINSRFETLYRDAEIDWLKVQLDANGDKKKLKAAEKHYRDTLAQLNDDQRFLQQSNKGSESMSADAQNRVKEIAKRQWRDSEGQQRPLLTENEVLNLNIVKGTLTSDERAIINGHISTTLRMLESLPFPKHLKNVPEIAGGHHEHMDGSGYPRGLTRDQMSVQARMMGITDIFEALTSADRPYKKPMPLSQALGILAKMRDDQHIDADLFEIFIRQKVYLQYAEKFLKPEQMDHIDEAALLQRSRAHQRKSA